MAKQVQIEFELGRIFNVSITENGHQWNTIYRSEDLDKAEIIEDAYVKVGYTKLKQKSS